MYDVQKSSYTLFNTSELPSHDRQCHVGSSSCGNRFTIARYVTKLKFFFTSNGTDTY